MKWLAFPLVLVLCSVGRADERTLKRQIEDLKDEMYWSSRRISDAIYDAAGFAPVYQPHFYASPTKAQMKRYYRYERAQRIREAKYAPKKKKTY